jgi:hypothetical protein
VLVFAVSYTEAAEEVTEAFQVIPFQVQVFVPNV